VKPSLRGTYTEFEFNAWRGSRTLYSHRDLVLAMVSRPELDHRLVTENRLHPGLSFFEGEPARSLDWNGAHFVVRTRERELLGRQLVAADGANGISARSFGGSPARGRAVAVEVVLRRQDLAGDPPARPCFDFGAVPRGYGWVFPKTAELSAGLYSLARGRKDLRGLLAAYLQAKGLRVRGEALASFEAHTLPLGGHGLAPSALPLYRVGDAAGFADALTGEGIYHALESGRLAGALAARVAAGSARPEDYVRELEPGVLGDTRWSWRLAGPFYRAPELWLGVLRASGLGRALVQGLASGATFRSALLHAPRALLARGGAGRAQALRVSG
jgi:flavin-dependent dehydrogenase